MHTEVIQWILTAINEQAANTLKKTDFESTKQQNIKWASKNTEDERKILPWLKKEEFLIFGVYGKWKQKSSIKFFNKKTLTMRGRKWLNNVIHKIFGNLLPTLHIYYMYTCTCLLHICIRKNNECIVVC